VSTVLYLQLVLAQRLTRYEDGAKLAGIIYIHRISDTRFTGMSGRSFKMFRQLCGESTLKNVILVTNMWGKVEQGVGEARERELADVYFKSALDRGAQLARHHNTTQSSHDIIRRIMKNDPIPLRIQRELIDEGKDINETAVGEVVNEELNQLIKHYEAETNALREEMSQAVKENDEETRKELEEETRKISEQMNKMRMESKTMTLKYNGERKKVEERMKRMQEEARQERERARAEHMKQINEPKAELERKPGVTVRSVHGADDFYAPTRPDFRLKPNPVPSTANQHRTTTLHLHAGGGSNSSADTSSPRTQPDTPEVSIMWVLSSPTYLTGLTPKIILLLANSVMGATGSGKSTVRSSPLCTSWITEEAYYLSPRPIQFINLVSGSKFDVGRTLRSCTNTIQVAEALNFDGHRVILIDTPGFDYTTRSDTGVLRMIAVFLEAS
jgi:hypothetical protein